MNQIAQLEEKNHEKQSSELIQNRCRVESVDVPFFGPAAVEAVNSVKVDPVVDSGEGGKAQLHDFRSEFSAPVTGITLSTRVGRLSETHSDIGFQLHSISRWEERRRTARWKSQLEQYG